MKAEVEKVAPYLKAGEVPPPGVSQIIDDARQEENKAFLKSLKDQEKAAGASNGAPGGRRAAEPLSQVLPPHGRIAGGRCAPARRVPAARAHDPSRGSRGRCRKRNARG